MDIGIACRLQAIQAFQKSNMRFDRIRFKDILKQSGSLGSIMTLQVFFR